MIYAIVGAGGKTGLMKEMAARFRQEGKSVFVTTTTHMFAEEDTLLTEDAGRFRSRFIRKFARRRMWFWWKLTAPSTCR